MTLAIPVPIQTLQPPLAGGGTEVTAGFAPAAMVMSCQDMTAVVEVEVEASFAPAAVVMAAQDMTAAVAVEVTAAFSPAAMVLEAQALAATWSVTILPSLEFASAAVLPCHFTGPNPAQLVASAQRIEQAATQPVHWTISEVPEYAH